MYIMYSLVLWWGVWVGFVGLLYYVFLCFFDVF